MLTAIAVSYLRLSGPPTLISKWVFLGDILGFAQMWISVVENAMLGGKLLIYSSSVIDLAKISHKSL
jgi:hypothetical protein